MAKENQQQNDYDRPRDSSEYRVRTGWFIIPLILLGLYGLFKSVIPSISWDHIMDMLNVHDKERYTMLAIWCLALIGVAALWRILRK